MKKIHSPLTKSLLAVLLILICTHTFGQTGNKIAIGAANSVAHFDKVIVSPHIEATFIKGDKEDVTVQSCTVSTDKINIESNGKTLRVYLDGAKEITKNEKVNDDNGRNVKKSIYKGTVLKVTITYKNLEALSVRGEENIKLTSKLDQENFDLDIYGESRVSFDGEVQLNRLRTTIYGESTLDFKSGNITDQKYTSYGESKVNAFNINGKIARVTLYGEAELNLTATDEIKITAFGESKINYKGNPQIKRNLVIGSAKINRMK